MTIREMLDKIQHRDGWEDLLVDEWISTVKGLNARLREAALDDPERARDHANQLKGVEMAVEVCLDAVINYRGPSEVVEPEPFKDDGY